MYKILTTPCQQAKETSLLVHTQNNAATLWLRGKLKQKLHNLIYMQLYQLLIWKDNHLSNY